MISAWSLWIAAWVGCRRLVQCTWTSTGLTLPHTHDASHLPPCVDSIVTRQGGSRESMADQHWTAVNAMASGMGTAADRPPHDESDDEGSFERTSSYSEAMTSPTPPTRKAAGSRAWMDRPPEPDAPDAPAPQPPHSDMALPDSEEESWEETARRESELPSQSTSRTSTASAASSAEPVEPADMDTATAAPHPTEIMFGKENVGKVHLRSQVKASW